MNGFNLLQSLKGYRTHVAVAVTILTALATMAGLLPTASGQAAATALAALALTFSRFAQSDLSRKLDALLLLDNGSTRTPPDRPAAWNVIHADGEEELADLSHGPITLRFPTRAALLLFGLLCLAQSGHAEDGRPRPSSYAKRTDGGVHPTVLSSMSLSPETRAWFQNPDGSCVQCSIGMAGVHSNDRNAASLLWDSPHGQAERGGSWPSRVEAYCDRRGIKAWSVTGSTIDDTLPWCEWAAKTGRFGAIGAGQAHFQTLYGRDLKNGQWLVCNNNSTNRIDRYSDAAFRRLHAASGPWVVVLQKPSSDPPRPVQWWK